MSPAQAAAPTLEYVYPAGGQQGATVQVTAAGAFEPWPVSGWADHSGIHIEAAAEKGKLSIRVDKEVPAGPHLVRLFNAEGASAPRVFVVGGYQELVEAEPNNELSQATAIPALPATVDARLEQRGDVDSYAVKLEAGQTLVASLQGRRLGAPMDPLLHLHDAAGHPVAFAHDGFGLDPLLVYRAERAGTYVLRVAAFADPPAADVSFTGAANALYRLSLTTGPFVRSAFPAGVSRGTKATIELRGWNLGPAGSDTSQPREVDTTQVPPDADHVMIPVPGGEQLLRIEIGDGPELTDADPQVSGPGAAPQNAPVALNGTIAQSGEEDVLTFHAKKDERFIFAVRAGAANAPLDAALRIEDDARKQLANDDDAAGNGDPRIEWPAPADGVYRAAVSDLYGAGGPECTYRLSVTRPQPRVTATLDAHEYRLAPGATAMIKLAVARTHGHADALVATAAGLPPGVTCPDVEIPAAGGEVTLTLIAAADVKAVGGPIRVLLRSPDPQRPATTSAAFDLSKDNGQSLVGRIELVWLTVLPPAKS